MSIWFCPSVNSSVPSLGMISIAVPAGMPPDWLTLQYTETFPNVPPCLVTVKVTGVPPDCSTTTRDWDSGVKPKRPKASSLGSMLTVRTLPMLLRLGVRTSGDDCVHLCVVVLMQYLHTQCYVVLTKGHTSFTSYTQP